MGSRYPVWGRRKGLALDMWLRPNQGLMGAAQLEEGLLFLGPSVHGKGHTKASRTSRGGCWDLLQ